MSARRPHRTATLRIAHLLNRQDLDALDNVFVEDIVTHAQSFPWELRNRSECQAFVLDLFDAFPDLWWEVESLVCDRELTAVRYSLQGTHRGRLAPLDLAPTGRSFDVTVLQVHRFESHRVVESWLAVDVVELLSQLTAGEADDRWLLELHR